MVEPGEPARLPMVGQPVGPARLPMGGSAAGAPVPVLPPVLHDVAPMRLRRGLRKRTVAPTLLALGATCSPIQKLLGLLRLALTFCAGLGHDRLLPPRLWRSPAGWS